MYHYPRTLTLYSGLRPLSIEPTTDECSTIEYVCILELLDYGVTMGANGKEPRLKANWTHFVYNIWERGNREGL
ncbi:hypothetical protein VTO73DRAFT_9590 [Trametes versicolor]